MFAVPRRQNAFFGSPAQILLCESEKYVRQVGYNTAIPSSSLVERLFPYAGMVLTKNAVERRMKILNSNCC